MVSNNDNIIYTDIIPHGCTKCGEVNKGFAKGVNTKLCLECGGKVLNLQEAFDYIMELEYSLNKEYE